MVQTGETEGQIVEFYEAVQRRLVGSLFAVPDTLSQVLEAIRTAVSYTHLTLPTKA